MLDMVFLKKDGSYTTNFILACDSYKVGQEAQLPAGTKKIHSNIVPRKGFEGINEVVCMGPQVVSTIFATVVITDEMIDEAEIEIEEQGYDFPRKNWEYIRDLGYLPLEVRSITEGSIVPIGLPLMTIENTDEVSAWLVSYTETMAQDIVWVMTTVASKMRPMKALMESFCKDTGTPIEWAEYMIHNFGDRGAGGQDRAVLTAMAHALFFSGSDCLRANRYLKKYYKAVGPVLSSLDASEHSTMCANSDLDSKNDFGAFEMTLGMLERAVKRAARGVGIPVISAVIDTYDDERFVSDFVIGNYDKICDIGGKYVCRPDSGNAIQKPLQVADWLQTGLTEIGDFSPEELVNEAGFKILPDNLGVLQGDGLRTPDLYEIVRMSIACKQAASNFAFGFGGGLTNGSGREDFSFSMKATARMDANGDWHDMQKIPKTDSLKISLRGRVTCYRGSDGSYLAERVSLSEFNCGIEDVMNTTYCDGSAFVTEWEDVRGNARAS